MSGYRPANASNSDDDSFMERAKGPVRTIATVVVVGMAILGFVAFIWDEGFDDSGGKYITRYDRVCVPNSHVALYQSVGSRAALLNVTTMEIKQTGHKIDLTLQYLNPFEVTIDDDSTTVFRSYIDARCVPPARVFRTCVGGICPAADTSTEELVNLTMTDQWFQSDFNSPAIVLVADQDEFALATNTYPIQGFNIQGAVGDDDQTYYGQLINVYVSAGASGTLTIPSLTVRVSYNTNSSKHWHIPSFCTGGPCLDESLAP